MKIIGAEFALMSLITLTQRRFCCWLPTMSKRCVNPTMSHPRERQTAGLIRAE